MAINNVDMQDYEGNSYWTMANPDSISEFTKATTRTNIASGDTHRTIFGKICKFFADLGTSAFSGLANNLTTTAAGYGMDARQGPVIQQKFDQINSNISEVNQNLNGYKFDVIDGIPSYKAGADAAWVPFSNPEVYFAQYSFPGDQSTIPFTLSKAQLWLLTNGNWFTQYQNQLKLQINGATVPVASYTKYNNCYIAKYDTKQYINSAASLLVNRSMVVANAYTYIMLIGV